VAGLANTPLSTPIEHVRIRLQTQPHGAARLYNGPLDCIRRLGVSGVYRGLSVTSFREAIAYGSWFLTFELAMQNDAHRNQIERKEIPSWKVALYGGIAGEMLWLSSYPFDVIKSKMQTDGFGADRQYRTWLDCASRTWAKEGARGFWRGIAPTLARAMPVSAGTFAV
jgi:solute carrier family 25 (mitochondrial carnitine/acylcarnitine transporter), member 20/29